MNDLLTGKIIAAAYTVYNKLGFGFLEKVYENAMVIELRKMGLEVGQQVPLSVFYNEQEIGHYSADLIIEQEIVVELKSVSNLITEHEVKLVHYLNATKKDLGLLLNFGEKGVEVKRKYRLYQHKQST